VIKRYIPTASPKSIKKSIVLTGKKTDSLDPPLKGAGLRIVFVQMAFPMKIPSTTRAAVNTWNKSVFGENASTGIFPKWQKSTFQNISEIPFFPNFT